MKKQKRRQSKRTLIIQKIKKIMKIKKTTKKKAEKIKKNSFFLIIYINMKIGQKCIEYINITIEDKI